VYVAGLAGATMLWVCAPPSDHDWKVYCCFPFPWGETALMVLEDPTITLRVIVAFADVPFTVKVSPPGTVWKLRVTIRGSRRRVTVWVSPPESVAVSRSSR
jgi:hypothetical protein